MRDDDRRIMLNKNADKISTYTAILVTLQYAALASLRAVDVRL